MATKTVPGRTRRESYSTPATPGFPLWERTSAPCRSCWKVIEVIINSARRFSRSDVPEVEAARTGTGPIHLPKRTVIRDPAATCAPGRGDCSRATPLPTASRSSPASCAASIATRRFLPRNDGTSIPPSSTSRTTVPLDGNFCAVEFSDCRVRWCGRRTAVAGRRSSPSTRERPGRQLCRASPRLAWRASHWLRPYPGWHPGDRANSLPDLRPEHRGEPARPVGWAEAARHAERADTPALAA